MSAHRSMRTESSTGVRTDSHPAPVSNPYRVRDMSSTTLIEIWLLATVIVILGIRLYLELTGYPQVGGETLHIAHMLWGGLGMLLALGMLLIFASDIWKPIAALVGGAGFGTFIDELGKFITQDNDYFYQPTVALIYVVLVVLFLISRTLSRVEYLTPSDHMFHAVKGIEQLAIGKLDPDRQQAALAHLRDSGYEGPLRDHLHAVLETGESIEPRAPSPVLQWGQRITQAYWSLVSREWLVGVVLTLFAVRLVAAIGTWSLSVWRGEVTLRADLSFSEWGALLSGVVAGAVAAYGLVMILRRHRRRGLQALINSSLMVLLVGQVFAFAIDQWAALTALAVELFVLGVLHVALASEDHPITGPSP